MGTHTLASFSSGRGGELGPTREANTLEAVKAFLVLLLRFLGLSGKFKVVLGDRVGRLGKLF